MLFGAGLLYVTFEGFGVVTNSAAGMRNPARQLPRAIYLALAIVLAVYVLVSIVVVLVLRLPAIDAAQGHVLAEAGLAVAGQAGFVAVGAAALLATASAVNATLFGDANLAYQVARDGQLQAVFARRIWPGHPASLFIAAGLTALVVLVFPLSAVGQMASLAFLIVYGMVSVGHLRIREQAGARRGPPRHRRGAQRRAVRPAPGLHDPHRADLHAAHPARRAGLQLHVRGHLPAPHRPPAPPAASGRA